MSKLVNEIPVRPKRDTFLIMSSIALVLFTAGFLGVALSVYRNRVQSITLRESRFVRTEWHLLADLKAQTDQELLEKDQEIADLNQRYASLLRHSGSQGQLQQIQTMLRQAKAQRQAILTRRNAAEATNPSDERSWIAKLLPSANASAVSQLVLQSRVAALEAQLSKSRAQDKALAAELKRLNNGQAALQQAIAQNRRETVSSPGPSIAELDTRALVSAIIGSPQVRSVYPDLLASLDGYLATYALQERAKGRQRAYASVEALLARIDGESGAVP